MLRPAPHRILVLSVVATHSWLFDRNLELTGSYFNRSGMSCGLDLVEGTDDGRVHRLGLVDPNVPHHAELESLVDVSGKT